MEPRFRTVARLVVVLCLLSAMVSADEVEPGLRERTLVLDTTSPWRLFNVLAPPVIRSDPGLMTVKHEGVRWLNWRTAEPATAWRTGDFDDSLWTRGTAVTFSHTPYLARLCLRARFTVTDPAKVDGLALALGYSGGAIVTVNGREISRTHLPKATGRPDALAEDYPRDVFVDGKGRLVPGERRNMPMARKPGDPVRRRVREVPGIPVPRSALRKGVNVLAIEIVRAPYDKALSKKGSTEKGRAGYDLNWSTCQVHYVQLTAAKADGLLLEATRPAGLRVWNNDVLMSDFDLDFGTSSEPLRPVRIVGARGGAFSGKVVAGSRGALRGLEAEVPGLRGPGGAVIPASAVSVRYGRPWGNEQGVNGWSTARYARSATLLGALDERPPEDVLFVPHKAGRYDLKAPNLPAPVAGAVVPVWVTIDVPRDARPGKYTAALTVRARGEHPVRVPVELTVADWAVPKPNTFRTWAELVQVPDAVAIEYQADLWSERHFELIEKSMSFLGKVGTRTVYLPLISETNQGNAESMVRWIPKDDGTYDYDFSPLERYLDAAEKHLGKPEIVCLWVWDVYINAKAKAAKGGKGGEARAMADLKRKGARLGEGPLVTVLDPTTRTTRTVELPLFTDPKSRSLWRPMFEELRRRLKRRGLDKAIAFGCMTDARPMKAEVAFLNEMIPGTPWVSHSHQGVHGRGALKIYGLAACVYQTRVWHTYFTSSLTKRLFGWKNPDLVAEYNRSRSLHQLPPTKWRHLCELNLTGSQRGIGRIGADNWRAIRDKNGQRDGYVWARYPHSSWRNLNLYSNLLAPGVDGPVATVRYEMFREGIQECEARIVIEEALTDPQKLEALGGALAAECQKALDDHARAMWTSQSNLQLTGPIYLYATGWRTRAGLAGNLWFIHSRWQDRTLGLFRLAGEVERALRKD